jgi:TPR repeat protein
MARMLYWGSQGITRDIGAALAYYRQAAETGDPQAMFDYGIVLLKGHGTKPDMKQAIQQFERAAALNHSGAINALGWHSLEIMHNFTEAARRFERAHSLGNKDASFNLGHMYLYGRNADNLVDRIKAFDYLAVAALRGQLEAGIYIAMFNMRGHPRSQRNGSLALDWARHVSEHNPAVGKFLTRGVRAYRQHNWPAALVYYAMAASTGVEVANFNLAYLCEENYEAEFWRPRRFPVHFLRTSNGRTAHG